MNRKFYGMLLAVLLSITTLLCIASAKDYSVNNKSVNEDELITIPLSSITNNGADQGELITIPLSAILHPGRNDLAIIVKQNAPFISSISVSEIPDGTNSTHITAWYELKAGSTASDNARALAAILQMYASFLNQDPEYNGYLEIIQDAVGPNTWYGQVAATYEAAAYETRANIDPTTGLLSIDYINQVISRGGSDTYYMSDGYGDVTKAVEVPGGRAGPSQGSWL